MHSTKPTCKQKLPLMPEFKRNLAVVIGINQYINGIPELKTAVNDANQLALILEENYQYQVLRVLDGEATKDKITSLLAAFEEQTLALPNDSKIHLEADDRFLFYFAGHGFAQDGLDNADGPVGFLVPQDARRDEDTWLKMQRLHDALIKLPCRHLLIILDCCFAGTFRWAGRDREVVRSQKVYRERYDRFIAGSAQQVITSAAHDEKATDSLYRFGQRGDNQGHSPFAELLFQALNGQADFTSDGVITATELYLYLRDKITTKQTPELSQLKRHDKGEYIFPVPSFDRNQLQAAPTLDEKTNPYKGLESFEAADSDKFFGRTALTEKLQEFVTTHGLTVVLGASGTGKSSLVKAGLIPQLKTQQGWRILAPFRPGESPFRALNNTLVQENLPVVDRETPEPGVKNLLARLANWSQLNPNSKLLLIIDQFEEIVTLSRNDTEREKFLLGLAEALAAFPEQLRLVLTLRNDFEPQLSDTALKPYWTSARFIVPAMTREQLREAIVEPAAAKVMYFEPPTLVDELIDEVMQMPGALPLLSFTLSELYLKYIKSVREGIRSERSITQADYEELGGVTRSLTQRADFEYEELTKRDEAYTLTIKQVMLRMVAVDVGELARRKVLLSELEYPQTKNEQVQQVIRQFTEARLLVKGQDSEGNSYVEPAHDALVRGWQKLLVWKQQEQESLILQRRLTPAALEWKSHQPTFHGSTNPRDWWKQFWTRQQQAKFLWHTNPRLDFLKQVLDSTDNWFNQVEDDFVRRSIECQLNNRRRTIGAVATGFAVVLGFAGYQWNQTQQAEIRSLAASSEALFVSDQQLEALIDSLKAEKQLKGLIGVADDTKTRAVAQLQQVVYWARELNRLEGHQGWVYSVAWSPDGKTIASACGDKTIKLWNKDGQNFRTLEGHDSEVKSVAWNKDGQTLASASGDKTIKLWSKDGKELRTIKGHSAVVNSVAWNKDGQTLASASNDKTIKLWSKDGKLLRMLKGHSAEVNSVAWNKDGQTLASASNDKTIKLWSKDGKLLKTLQKDIEWVNSVAWSPDGQTLASASGDKTIKLWRIADGKPFRTFRGHGDVIRSVTWSPKGEIIASASDDKTIKLWRMADGQELGTFQGHTAATGSVAWSPDGQTLASASGDNTIRLWSKDSQGLLTLIGHSDGVKSVALSPDGKIIASGSADKDIKLWSQESQEPRTLKGYDGGVKSVAWSPDGQTIAAALIDGTIRLWGVDGKEREKIKAHNSAVNSVAWSFDGQTLVSAGGDGDMTLKLWKIANGKYFRIKTLQERSVITSVVWHPEGQTIAMALADGTIALSSVDGTQLRTFQGHMDAVTSVAWSPDGQTLASASADKTIRIWSKDGKLLKTRQNHSKSVNSVAWSPDSQTLASASADKTIKIWSKDGQEIGTLKGHRDAVNSVIFSPDGKSVASASDDKTVLLWNLELLDRDVLFKHGCDRVRGYLNTNPNVTKEDRHLCDGMGTSGS